MLCRVTGKGQFSLSIRLFGGGGGGRVGREEGRKGKREEKPDTEALRRVFHPLDEHDPLQ